MSENDGDESLVEIEDADIDSHYPQQEYPSRSSYQVAAINLRGSSPTASPDYPNYREQPLSKDLSRKRVPIESLSLKPRHNSSSQTQFQTTQQRSRINTEVQTAIECALEELSPDVIIDEETQIEMVNEGNLAGYGGG